MSTKEPPTVYEIGYAKVDECLDDYRAGIIGWIDAINLHLPFYVMVAEPEDTDPAYRGPVFDIHDQWTNEETVAPVRDMEVIGYAVFDTSDPELPRINLVFDSPAFPHPIKAYIKAENWNKSKDLWKGEKSRFRFWQELTIYWQRED